MRRPKACPSDAITLEKQLAFCTEMLAALQELPAQFKARGYEPDVLERLLVQNAQEVARLERMQRELRSNAIRTT